MTHFPVPNAPFARKPWPWYKRVTAAFTAPQGGIPTARAIPRQVDCGPFILAFLEPSSAFGETIGAADSVSLGEDAFTGTNLSDWRSYHKTIKLAVSNWVYQLPRWNIARLFPVPHPPYAIITAYWQLERVKHGIQLDPENVAMLEDYLRHDYVSYLDSEGGPNWQLRDQTYRGKTISGDPLPQYQIDNILDNSLQRPPGSYEVVTSNGLRWLRYLWEPAGMRNTLNYTTILLPDVLLTASFHITHMNSEPGADWWSLFMEDCEILVKTIACQRKALPHAD
ncbi:hypothetical protein PY254_13620 [Rhodanobacter sp. AS-Z3]|uniref:hypothetical protein n=1 Tax=Rhodanobacter sp. AS-Z3 TaxID=3031330 RepID=UPI002479961E|nr:hypothetical protein [Rhodanobacter sp. AS-Z3]WEN14270.1 hypothetical protein PY254_13620 [Rhodanobacter sp. AS-Z3]